MGPSAVFTCVAARNADAGDNEKNGAGGIAISGKRSNVRSLCRINSEHRSFEHVNVRRAISADHVASDGAAAPVGQA